jgi:hypothetical protein
MRVAILALTSTLLLAGCGQATESAPEAVGANTADENARTDIVGATSKQEALLREMLEGLAPTIVREVRISAARSPWTPDKPHSVVLNISYSDSPDRWRGEWEAALLAQGFATRSRLLHLPPVAGYESRTNGLALDGPEEPEPDTRREIDRPELAKMITAAVRQSGAEIVELRVVQPMNPAAAVTLRVRAPAFYLKHRLEALLQAMPSSATRRYDGLYVRIVDRQDRFVWISAQTNGESAAGGSIGARKDLQGCDPIPRIGVSPRDPPPPPCPVD